MEAPIIAAHVGVDVDLCGGLVGEAHELPGVEGAHDHVARLLELAEGGGRRRVVAVLHRLQLPEDVLRNAARLQKVAVLMVFWDYL